MLKRRGKKVEADLEVVDYAVHQENSSQGTPQHLTRKLNDAQRQLAEEEMGT